MSFAKKKKDQPADLFLEWLFSVLADPKKKDQPADLSLECLFAGVGPSHKDQPRSKWE